MELVMLVMNEWPSPSTPSLVGESIWRVAYG